MPSISRPQMPASIDQFVKFSNKHLLCFLPCCPSGLRRARMCIHKTNCYPPLNPLLKFSFAKNLKMVSLQAHGKHPLVWSRYSLILIHLWSPVLYFDYIIISPLGQRLAGWFMFLQHLVHSGSRPQFGLQGAVVTQMRKKVSIKKSSRLIHEATSEKQRSKRRRVISFNILCERLQETSC